MPVAITVGSSVLTINHGNTFMVTDLNGEIAADSEHGVFAEDTRYVSGYALTANGERWIRLTSSTTAYYAARIYLTNSAFMTEDGQIPEGALALVVSRTISDGIHEDLDLTNHGPEPVRFNLELALGADFADLFEVKAHKFVRRGRILTHWDEADRALHTTYRNNDFHRRVVYRVLNRDGMPPHYANGRITFEITLAPGATWHACGLFVLVHGEHERHPRRGCYEDHEDPEYDALQRQWQAEATQVLTSNEDFYRLYRQSVEDMGALRLHDGRSDEGDWLPAAGVPWFVTVFGRDSLIVSLQCMCVDPRFALGALRRLGALQATEMDDWRDAEPGKIPHECRYGELAHFKRVPHTPYYGTADATPLYLITLHEAWRWLGDTALLRRYRDVALGCLSWIDQYGDLDGDGLQEYATRSSQGYENVGWKDAGDAVVYPDGSQVRQPKALCELQGYVFDAKLRMAEAFDALGEPDRAQSLRDQAADLRTRFEARFWCEGEGTYAFALDPDKRPVCTVASNAGHCLWSGIARPDRAARVAARLLQPDMWSGWGIRTLSAANPAYNPFSYQRGSVWPHDNGLIALGFKRYGLTAEAAHVARDVSEAASFFVSYRLPELFAGIPRQPNTFPVLYPGANVPQAWAAGTVFNLLQAILGLQADAPRGRLYVDPDLPPWLPDVALRGLRVGPAMVDLRCWREEDLTRWDATIRGGDLAVEQRPWGPWSSDA